MKTTSSVRQVPRRSGVTKKWNKLEIFTILLATAVLLVVLYSPSSALELVSNFTSALPFKVMGLK
jgi:hypothetical protein